MIVPDLFFILFVFFLLTAISSIKRRNSRKFGITITLAGVCLLIALAADAVISGLEWWQGVLLIIAAICFACAYQVRREREAERLARLFQIRDNYDATRQCWEMCVPPTLSNFLERDFRKDRKRNTPVALYTLIEQIAATLNLPRDMSPVGMSSFSFTSLDIHAPNTSEGRKKAEEIATQILPVILAFMKERGLKL